jgi:hypothetical protein
VVSARSTSLEEAFFELTAGSAQFRAEDIDEEISAEMRQS